MASFGVIFICSPKQPLVEAAFYRLVFEESDAVEALGISALANGASLGIGLLVRGATGWV